MSRSGDGRGDGTLDFSGMDRTSHSEKTELSSYGTRVGFIMDEVWEDDDNDDDEEEEEEDEEEEEGRSGAHNRQRFAPATCNTTFVPYVS